MRLVIVLVITVFACSAALADVYEWVDRDGVTHFTDDLHKVPARYRDKMKRRESATAEKRAPEASAPPPAPETLQGIPKAGLYGGHDESWWRSGFRALREQMKRIQGDLPGKKDELTKLHHEWVVSMGRTPKAGETRDDRFIKPPPESKEELSHALSTPGRHREAYYNKKAEIERDEVRIKEIEVQIAALDAEATRAGVPFEWRK